MRELKQELAEKIQVIQQLNFNLDKEGETNDKIEIENQKLIKELGSLKETNKDLKDKMHYYKKSCEKMNKELREVYETIGEQKAKITVLEKENEQNLKRFAMHLGSSLPTNLLPTRDTNNSKHLFDYKTTAGLEEAVDEDDEMDEFSDLMNMKNKTQIVESLADELDFYDNADDPYSFGDHFINEVNNENQESKKSPEGNGSQKCADKNNEETKNDNSFNDNQNTNLPDENKESKNDNNNNNIENTLSNSLCPKCLKARMSFNSNNSSDEHNTSHSSGTNSKTLQYFASRDPMKEFFILTAQSVKLNSPYMDSILTLHINEMYECVEKTNIPFNKWGQWIEDYLHRTILSKIYAEAFEYQSMKERNTFKEPRRSSDGQLMKSRSKSKDKIKKPFSFFGFLKRNKGNKEVKKRSSHKKSI